MRQKRVEHGAQGKRPQRLHGDVVLEVQQRVDEVGEVADLGVRDPQVPVKRRDDDVAVADEHLDRIHVVVAERAAGETMREQEHRKARQVRPQRRLAAALHVRNPHVVGKRIVGPRIVGARRVADQRRHVDAERPRNLPYSSPSSGIATDM